MCDTYKTYMIEKRSGNGTFKRQLHFMCSGHAASEGCEVDMQVGRLTKVISR